ncbi:piggyBac transposable element-derived protein 4-like [Colletes gigas]|uniref:piggyBac transposable element-derived protein 4-like n=1 Tax=Colletes gigas TaxID=935657 RepID=UPI001C9A5066|nr:piggyBac transposable element-derived protein 4-like [Colletes gigas]
MAEQVQKDSAESLVPSHFDNGNASSNSDDSLIHPVGLTSSRRRRILSSESEFSQNSGTTIAGWEEVFQDTDNPPEAQYKFNEIPGPNHTLPRAAAPIAYFYLFFTNILLETIVNETNAYADNFLSRRNLHPNSRARKWQDITISELKGFIACVINMGLQKRPTISSYWSTNNSQYNPWFHQMFSRNRFQLILKFFHLADTKDLPRPGQPGYDPCGKIQPLIDHANTVFRQIYTPHEQMSIDESLVGTKNHTQLLQYLPNKHHHRWGIKLWMLCDSVSNYCLAIYIYRGAGSAADRFEIQENGLAHTVVMKLLTKGNYFSKGYHIFVDNFFTSIPLAKALYDLGTYITGTIRRNRKGPGGICI